MTIIIQFLIKPTRNNAQEDRRCQLKSLSATLVSVHEHVKIQEVTDMPGGPGKGNSEILAFHRLSNLSHPSPLSQQHESVAEGQGSAIQAVLVQAKTAPPTCSWTGPWSAPPLEALPNRTETRINSSGPNHKKSWVAPPGAHPTEKVLHLHSPLAFQGLCSRYRSRQSSKKQAETETR